MTAVARRRPILIVEDDADIREALQDALEGEGYRVATAEHGKDGLERLREIDEPCLILLDLMMPVMSGGEFLIALRNDDALATIPVIVVSAWPEEAAKVREHAQGYVKKPVALDALLEVVCSFCPGEAERSTRRAP